MTIESKTTIIDNEYYELQMAKRAAQHAVNAVIRTDEEIARLEQQRDDDKQIALSTIYMLPKSERIAFIEQLLQRAETHLDSIQPVNTEETGFQPQVKHLRIVK